MEAGEGSPETKGKKTDEKAFSFIYFSKIFNCQMHLLFPEVIILSSFLYDLAVTLGGGSNLFLALLFQMCLSCHLRPPESCFSPACLLIGLQSPSKRSQGWGSHSGGPARRADMGAQVRLICFTPFPQCPC